MNGLGVKGVYVDEKIAPTLTIVYVAIWNSANNYIAIKHGSFYVSLYCY